MSVAPDYQTPERMALKQRAIPLADFAGKRVLDVGCDMGAWCWIAKNSGAEYVLGLDRNRVVKGHGLIDLVGRNRLVASAIELDCEFEQINLGKQWREFGRFDIILVLSMYHHWFENCDDHGAIWFWLWRHTECGGQILWEGPIDDSDPVVRANVSDESRKYYTRDAILKAASYYFDAKFIGPALHEPSREVWRFRPRQINWQSHNGTLRDGAGGAAAAFEYASGRRMDEIERVLGWRPIPGSLNVMLDGPFGWEDGFYRSQVLDVRDRSAGLQSEWALRWARFYPVRVNGEDACAFRFEGERYDPAFAELIAPRRLRDRVEGPVTLCR